MNGGETARVDATGGAATNALVAGALGGLIGAAGLGALMWLANPDFVRTSVPALYGLEPTGVAGWTLHLAHGVVFGLVFAAIVSRDVVEEALTPETDPAPAGPISIRKRIVAAGVAYGLAIWAIFPMIAMPVWLGYVGGGDLTAVPFSALESLFGHALFGLLLGVVYGVVVD